MDYYPLTVGINDLIISGTSLSGVIVFVFRAAKAVLFIEVCVVTF